MNIIKDIFFAIYILIPASNPKMTEFVFLKPSKLKYIETRSNHSIKESNNTEILLKHHQTLLILSLVASNSEAST